MIWEEEILKDRRRREQHAFFAGMVVACAVIFLVCWGVVLLTGGEVCL